MIKLLGSGEVFTFGSQEMGQLGNGITNKENNEVPSRVDALVGETIVDVSCGLDHNLVLNCMSFLHLLQ